MTHNIQIDDIVREATADELEIIKQRDNADKAFDVLVKKQQAAKASALEKLKALGLTDAEIAALVG